MQDKLCTRKMDELGRIILPQEVRYRLKMREKQNLDVYIDGDTVLLKLNTDIRVCSLCGESEKQLIELDGSVLCGRCVSKIKQLNN